MSFEAMAWVVRVLEGFPAWKPPVRFVLLIMANRADEEGTLYPSVRWIMQRTALSESAVRAATRQIQRAGLLLKEKQVRDDGGQSSNLYRLAMSQYTLKLSTPGAYGAGGGVHDGPPPAPNTGEGVHTKHPPGAYGGPVDTKVLNKRKDSLCPLSADLFDQAWKAYPNRAGNNPRARALKQWSARVRAGADPAELLAAVTRYSAFCSATGKIGLETVMMAASFFGADKPYEQAWELPPQREIQTGPPWYATEAGMLAKGEGLGLKPRPGETWPQFKGRINEALERRVQATA